MANFRVLKSDGKVCCSGDPSNFCESCVAAHSEGRSIAMPRPLDTNSVPPPLSMRAAIARYGDRPSIINQEQENPKS